MCAYPDKKVHSHVGLRGLVHSMGEIDFEDRNLCRTHVQRYLVPAGLVRRSFVYIVRRMWYRAVFPRRPLCHLSNFDRSSNGMVKSRNTDCKAASAKSVPSQSFTNINDVYDLLFLKLPNTSPPPENPIRYRSPSTKVCVATLARNGSPSWYSSAVRSLEQLEH